MRQPLANLYSATLGFRRCQSGASRYFQAVLEHGPQSAIADFDRDGSLDIVWVKGAPDTTTSVVDYTIELQLSARGRKSIHILAPAGGLILRARDVNRDNAIDLALVTAGRKRPWLCFSMMVAAASTRPNPLPSRKHSVTLVRVGIPRRTRRHNLFSALLESAMAPRQTPVGYCLAFQN